jgi:hypothetical protein
MWWVMKEERWQRGVRDIRVEAGEGIVCALIGQCAQSCVALQATQICRHVMEASYDLSRSR